LKDGKRKKKRIRGGKKPGERERGDQIKCDVDWT
jgi:hypothetical protein